MAIKTCIVPWEKCFFVWIPISIQKNPSGPSWLSEDLNICLLRPRVWNQVCISQANIEKWAEIYLLLWAALLCNPTASNYPTHVGGSFPHHLASDSSTWKVMWYLYVHSFVLFVFILFHILFLQKTNICAFPVLLFTQLTHLGLYFTIRSSRRNFF